jgi:hypothetical protein
LEKSKQSSSGLLKEACDTRVEEQSKVLYF